jgi:hypothetical protein
VKPKEFWLVQWEDIATHDEGTWFDIDKFKEKDPTLVFSVGWPVRESEHFYYICMDYCDGEGTTLGKIPKTAVRHIKKVKLRGFPPKEKKLTGSPVEVAE